MFYTATSLIFSSKVRIERWFDTPDEAIAAFERNCKRLGLEPPLHYPPGVAETYSITIASPTRAGRGLGDHLRERCAMTVADNV